MELSVRKIVEFDAPYELPDLFFSAKEIARLREVLRISLGGNADQLTEEELSEFGRTMLEATTIALKAKATKVLPLEIKK